jgi:peroxiredoxin
MVGAMRMPPSVLPLLGSFWLAVAIPSQTVATEPFGHSRHGAEFNEGPRRAGSLMPGLNADVHFPVVGLSTEAQAFFDQGICQQHGFWYFEAERSFREVLRRHPDCALAYWGIAMANVDNRERAAGFAAQAVQRSKALPERERLYVEALAKLYQIDDALTAELQSGDAERIAKAKASVVGKKERDEKALQRQFLKGLEAVVAACPDDLEAKAFLAIQSWRNLDHGIEISSHGAVDGLLELVLQKVPLHPAHHYRVHLWDREAAVRASRSAAVLGDTAPAIAHQWHMAGHIYAKLDRHAEAAWQQEASARVDQAHMARERVMPFLIHNYGHNQEWLARSLAYVGRAEAALAVAKNLAELPRHPVHNKLEDGEHIAGYARARLVSTCEDYELWADAIELAATGHLEASESVRGEVQRLGLLGRAHFRLGQLDDGKRIQGEVAALLQRARALRAEAIDQAEGEAHAKKQDAGKTLEAIAVAGREPTATVGSVLDLQRELAGEALLAAGDAKGAVACFEAIADFPKTLLADALAAAGEVDRAVELMEKEVKERPARVPTLARLSLALCGQNQRAVDAEQKAKSRQRIEALGPRVATMRDSDLRSLLQRRLGLTADGCFPTIAEPVAFGEDFGQRPPLDTLGPEFWQPTPHAGFDLPLVSGGTVALAAQPSRPTLVVFYLGFGCLHCVEQLQALRERSRAFAGANIDIVAIGNQDAAATAAALQDLPEEQRPRFPLLCDPDLAVFRAWHCHDDFENMPLHGTFLVDTAGRVRWQDIGAEPFLQLDWLLPECQRLLALPSLAAER